MSQGSERHVAIITGAAGGIGAEIARQLAQTGQRVVVADLNLEAADAIARALPGHGHIAVRLDVAQPDSVREAFRLVEDRLGPAAVLVHAAGVLLTEPDGRHARIWEFDVTRWDKTIAINARGAYLVTAEFLRMREARPVDDGRIVLISSMAAQNGGSYRTYADYAASKAAVIGMMRAVARECAPMGITVNAIAPGQIETPMLRRNIPEGTPVDVKSVPLGRYGTPADIAAAVGFIVSKEASFITGATFDINGGMRMQ